MIKVGDWRLGSVQVSVLVDNTMNLECEGLCTVGNSIKVWRAVSPPNKVQSWPNLFQELQLGNRKATREHHSKSFSVIASTWEAVGDGAAATAFKLALQSSSVEKPLQLACVAEHRHDMLWSIESVLWKVSTNVECNGSVAWLEQKKCWILRLAPKKMMFEQAFSRLQSERKIVAVVSFQELTP